MKNSIRFILPTLVFFFVACEGDPGPPGPEGLPGINILGSVFEVEGSFNAANDFSLFFDFPTSIEVFESDIVLVYLLEDVVDDGNGGTADVWTPLPQTFFVNGGLLQYTFNNTFFDVLILLDANFDLNIAPAAFTQNQIFRIAVVPAEFAEDPNINLSSLSDVMNALDIKNSDVISRR
ncbi:collagen-like protein [Leptobacterium sp. I13]|uniref:collagen-like protein n=1 Tax=Leptobacterium meishanense TaxID=3128904 RepID=UPI0030EE53FD